jgi:hypothetical protein
VTPILPPFTTSGDLPEGVHTAGWAQIDARFGGSPARDRLLARLRHLHELAARTGKLKRFLVFGSLVSDVPAPRDVDIALVMAADFQLENAPRESQTLFSHADAEARFGASVFWVRESMLPEALMLANQTRRDPARNRGGNGMIRNDQELAVMRERVAGMERLLQALRTSARPEEWPALSSGYRLEIERMQGEILDYLVQGAPDKAAA